MFIIDKITVAGGGILLSAMGFMAIMFSIPIIGVVSIGGGILAISYPFINADDKFDKLFKSLKFYNANEEMPRLISKSKTDYGYDYTFSLPVGLNIEHFQKIQLSMEQFLDSRITFEYKDKQIIARSSEVKLEMKYPYKFVKTDHPCDIVIGYTATGIRTIRLDRHMLICGSTGWGKSVMENTIITNLILNNGPENMVLNLCDFSYKELGIYEDCKIVDRFVMTKDKLMQLMVDLEKTCHGRLKLFKESKVRDIERYNMKSDKKLRYVITFIDEFAQINEKKDKDLFDIIQRLTALARATGIFFIVCTQRPSIDVLPGTIRSNIDIRACFHTADGSNSEIVLDQEGAEKLSIKGRGLLRYAGGELEEFHSMILTEEQIESLIKPKLKEVFMITERDKRIIEYLKTKEADSKELHDKFFHEYSPQWSNKRLKTLFERGHIKRKKGVDDQYIIYYV